MYNKQPLKAGILYEFSLKPKIKDENKSNTRIPDEEQIKQLKDRLNEIINSKTQTVNEKIDNLNRTKRYYEKLIEGDNKKQDKKASKVHTGWLNRVLDNLKEANKSLEQLKLEENSIKMALYSKTYSHF